jgi:hypothetical protein
MQAMSDPVDYRGLSDDDIFVPKYSDEDLEAAVGNPQAFPTSPVRSRCARRAAVAALGLASANSRWCLSLKFGRTA